MFTARLYAAALCLAVAAPSFADTPSEPVIEAQVVEADAQASSEYVPDAFVTLVALSIFLMALGSNK